MILEGNISVKAAILGGKRVVEKIYVDSRKDDKDTRFILHQAEERKIPVERIPREKVDEIAQGRTHGGMLCVAGARHWQDLPDVLSAQNPFLMLVEGVEDPFNLGYIMRSFYCAGGTALLLGKRSWEHGEAQLVKASAGASEYLPVVMAEDLGMGLRTCKEHGIRCYAAMRKDAVVYDAVDYSGPVCIAVGGEMRGLSSSTRAEIEENIYIPYGNDFRNALNASSACAVLSFEVNRQRRQHEG